MRLARSGVRTVLAARDAESLARLKTEIETMDQTTEIIPCDVTRYEACEDLARKVGERFGRILRPGDVADAIHFALTRTEGTVLNELTLRPAWQER
jgi:NAD(P)-dependent dehydrogenase (short-subunit alcohol dehydrogenase family)